MGTNQFDKNLSPATRRKVEQRKSFILALAEANALVHSCEELRQDHKVAWEQRKQEHHARRLEHAEEREDADGPCQTAAEHERQNQENDERFAHIKHEDQLLELPRHEDYLQGRRALARRKQVREVEVNVTVKPEPEPEVGTRISGIQIWGGFWALFFILIFLFSLSGGLWAVLELPVFLFAWCWLVRLPGYTIGGLTQRGAGKGGSLAV